jgi:hypothetical protein
LVEEAETPAGQAAFVWFQEVNDNDIIFLPIAGDNAQSAVRHAGGFHEIIVDYDVAKLQVNTFGSSFLCD